MKIRFFNSVLALLVAGMAVSVSGCNEDSIIKASIAPAADNIMSDNKIGDTLTIWAKTVLDDSINTSYSSSSIPIIHGLGTLNDPFAGKTNWGIYMQVIPTTSNLSLPAHIDSAVLILPYAGYTWGDTTGAASESFTVYPVTETLSKDSTYYSKTVKQYNAVSPVSPSVTVALNKLSDSVKVQGLNRTPHMRIKLSEAYKNEIVDAAQNSSDNATFLSRVKGIYIRATDTNNGSKRVPYFYLTGAGDYSRASIALYYSLNGSNNPDSVKASFLNFVYTDCAHYNYISRNYDGSPLKALMASTAISDQVVAIQNEPGAALDIRIPYLKNLPVGIINKAQLVITEIPTSGDTSKYTTLSRIYPVGIDATGKSYTILDREPISSTGPLDFIDGGARSVTLSDGNKVTQYYINIPREVQKAIVNKTNELHLRINGTITYPGAYRLKAGGSNSNSLYKIRLNIVYTKVN